MRALLLLLMVIATLLTGWAQLQDEKVPIQITETNVIKLPGPAHDSNTSIEEALLSRRSVREFKDEPLSLREVSQLLWAAQGITGPGGLRTAPSAGALYPLSIYVAAGNVEGIPPGVYRYEPYRHELVRAAGGDKRAELSGAALGQPSIKDGAVDIVIAGIYERATGKYNTPVRDERMGASYPVGVRYVHMEAGHAAQNICLQAVSLHLGTVTIGAFSDGEVKKVMGMRDDERPLYIMPVGRI